MSEHQWNEIINSIVNKENIQSKAILNEIEKIQKNLFKAYKAMGRLSKIDNIFQDESKLDSLEEAKRSIKDAMVYVIISSYSNKTFVIPEQTEKGIKWSMISKDPIEIDNNINECLKKFDDLP